MKKTLPASLLLSFALATFGCKSPVAPQSTQTPESHRDTDSGSQYNSGYERESRHHHRHGHGGEEGNDSWTTYDREPTSDEAANRGAQDEVPNQRAKRSRGNSHAVSSTPGQFDFYLLNLSWSPEFCFTHSTAAECAQHRAFTLHGLWPQNNDGSYPEDCSETAGPANPSQYADIYPDAALLQHEWQTHGTCSGLAPDQFLSLARRAEGSVKIPDELAHPSEQMSLTPDAIVALFTRSNPSLPADSIAISCGNNFLTAVEVCLDKNLKAQSCNAVRSCRANQVRIVPPKN